MKFNKALLIGLLLAGFSGVASADATFMSEYTGRFTIKDTPKDSPIAKEFLKSGKNGYTEIYAKDAKASLDGRKVYRMYSCLACHGGNGGGLTGPSIIDENWNNSKAVTDKGMFEIIAAGTNNGMGARHQQVAKNPNLLTTDETLKIIGWLRASYQGPKKDAAGWNK